MSRSMMENEIVTLLGGRVAEAIVLGDISTGASNDIQRASSIARHMVMKYGMSDKLGPILYGSESSSDEIFLGRDFNQTQNYSEETASVIDAEVKEIVLKAYRDCEQVLRDNMDRLHFIASYLIKNEIMEEEQFVRAMSEPDVTIEQLEEMVAEKRRKSQEENEAHARRMAEMEKQREREAAEKERAHKPGFPLRPDDRDHGKTPDPTDDEDEEPEDPDDEDGGDDE
jgi:cell division protease FtsH